MSRTLRPLAAVDGGLPLNDDRVALDKEAPKRSFLGNLFYVQGKFPALASQTYYYMALAYTVRDRTLQRWISTPAAYTAQGSRTVAYLSAKFWKRSPRMLRFALSGAPSNTPTKPHLPA